MSLSPLPPDPYVALGVSKDADLGQIRTSHRKLVLKYHPDRIKGDNSEEKNRAKNEFQKVQQAYEILSDPIKRSRYDDQLKLIELQKERMTRNAAQPAAFTPRPTSGPTSVRREMRTDGVFYEERAPPTSYFDSRDRFDEPLPRAAARKHEAPYEKERRPSVAKTTERKSSRMAEGISIAAGLKAAGSRAKDRVRETHARSQEQRDREKRRERSEKQTGRRAAFSAEVESETDSDTIGPEQSPRSRRPSPRAKQESIPMRSRPSSVRRGAQSYDEESYDDEKWEQHHKNGREYIAESQKRPNLARNGSDAYSYWAGGDVPSVRRSGSDSEKRPSSSRRTKADDSRSRPSMPVHSSAPSNLRPYVVEERAPQRAQTNSYPEREHRPAPSLGRSQTMPTSRSVKKDTLPTRGSNLKHAETQDSGYYSSSNPHTPEMKGESPPPSRENSKKKGSSTKYQIVNAESDDDRASRIRILDSDEESRHRRYRSPEPDRRERERDRERERYREPERERERDRDRDRGDHGRPRMERERPIRTESDRNISSRTVRSAAPTSFPRGEFRHEQPPSRSTSAATRPKLFGEVSSDDKEAPYSYQYDPSRVKTTTHRPPTMAGYGVPRFREAEDDYSPGSTFKDHIRAPHMRRPSAAY